MGRSVAPHLGRIPRVGPSMPRLRCLAPAGPAAGPSSSISAGSTPRCSGPTSRAMARPAWTSSSGSAASASGTSRTPSPTPTSRRRGRRRLTLADASRTRWCATSPDSTGRRNTPAEEPAMSTPKRDSDKVGRAPLHSPGRPPVARQEHRRPFWAAIADRRSSEDAARSVGVSPAVGVRWSHTLAACPRRTSRPLRHRLPGGTSRSPSAKRSHCYALRGMACARPRVRSAGPRRRSPVSSAETQPPGVARSSTARPPHSGTPTGPPGGRSRPGWPPTRGCGTTSRTVWVGPSLRQAGR